MRQHYAIILFVAGYFAIGVAVLNGLQQWGDDFAMYIAQARALVETGTLKEPAYIYNGWIGPPSYPPVLPLMLAPVYAVAGLDLYWLKVPIFISFCVGLFAAYLVFTRRSARGVALAAIILFAATPYVWAFRQQILSEFPYMMLTFLALYCGCRRNTGKLAGDVLYAVSAGGLTALACATRQVGLVLMIAIVLSNLFWITDRRAFLRFVCVVAAFFAVQAAFDLLFSGSGHNVAERRICLSCIFSNAREYYQSLAGAVLALAYQPNPYRIVDFVLFLFLAPAGIGFLVLLRDAFRKQSGEAPLWLRLPRSVSALDLYVGGMMLALLILPFAVAPRYILPVLPMLFFYFSAGLSAAGRLAMSGRRLLPAATVLLLALFLTANVINARLPQQLLLSGALTTDTRELYDFLRENVTQDDLIFVSKPRAFALFTRRPSTVWDRDVRPDTFMAEVAEKGVTHLVVGKAWSGLPTEGWMLSAPMMARNFDIVFENAQFRVLKRKR